MTWLLVCTVLAGPVRLVVGTHGPDLRQRAGLGVQREIIAKSGGIAVRALPFALVIDVANEKAAKALLEQLESVRFVARDERILVRYRQPNDPLLADQWHLDADGLEASADASIAWSLAFAQTDGTGVRVAVVDDGFDLNHEDLAFTTPGRDFSDGLPGGEDPVARPGDDHGTQVAGVIGARANNGLGVAGVCPGCTLVPVRLTGGGGPADLYEIDSSAAAAAIVWAVDEGAADVVNNSWGPPDGSPFQPDEPRELWPIPIALDEALRYAAREGRGGRGTLVTFAAGNGNELATYDGFASHPCVLAVGAIDAEAKRAWYSDYGPTVRIVAPSSGAGLPGVVTTDRSGALGDSATSYVTSFGGTSAASAVVAGVAALLFAEYPSLTGAQAMEAMFLSAFLVDPARAKYDEGGFSLRYGYGRVDAAGALAFAATYGDTCTFAFELCGNDRDDDCNGILDDPSRCAPCVPDAGLELCDGRDNDCDGLVDEEFVCELTDRPVCAPCEQSSQCAEGTRCRPAQDTPGFFCFAECGGGTSCEANFTCDGEVCVFTPSQELPDCESYLTCATPERCDGKDNDCDGVVDDVSTTGLEAKTAAARCGSEGVCAGREARCDGGSWACDRPLDWQADENRCDGLDNDCDGTIDEHCPRADCQSGLGDPLTGLFAAAALSARLLLRAYRRTRAQKSSQLSVDSAS